MFYLENGVLEVSGIVKFTRNVAEFGAALSLFGLSRVSIVLYLISKVRCYCENSGGLRPAGTYGSDPWGGADFLISPPDGREKHCSRW